MHHFANVKYYELPPFEMCYKAAMPMSVDQQLAPYKKNTISEPMKEISSLQQRFLPAWTMRDNGGAVMEIFSNSELRF